MIVVQIFQKFLSHLPKRRLAKNNLAFVLIVLLLSSPAQQSFGQIQIDPRTINVAEGLVSPYVTKIIQDKYGLIWVATNNGLQKFDGNRFTTFKNIPGNSTSLSSNVLWSVTEGLNDDLWVTSNQGISRFDRRTNQFKNYQLAQTFPLAADVPSGGRTFGLNIDSKKRIWAVTQNIGILKYNATQDKWEYANLITANGNAVGQSDRSLGFFEDKEGGIWASTDSHGLFYCNAKDSVFRSVEDERLKQLVLDNSITALYMDRSNTLWITTQQGVYKYNPGNKSFKTVVAYTKETQSTNVSWNWIAPDTEGNMWIANNFRGVLKFKGISDDFEEVSIAGKVKMNNQAWNITMTRFMVDRSGIFWFSSVESGILKYDPLSKPFVNIAYDSENKSGLGQGGVYGMLSSKARPGYVYVGSRSDGLTLFHFKNKSFKNIKYKLDDGRYGRSVRSMAEDPDGSLWLGTWGDGLIKLDKDYKEIAHYKAVRGDWTSISNNFIRVIKPDQGKLWIGTLNGLNILDPATGVFKHMPSAHTQTFPKPFFDEINNLLNGPTRIGKIDSVRNFQNISREVEIKTPGKYLAVAVGEALLAGSADYGFILNQRKDTVWIMEDYVHSKYAGGGAKNRVSIGVLDLNPGTYTMHYQADDSHAFDTWNEDQPDYLSLYGIAIVKPKDQQQLESLRKLMTLKTDTALISDPSILGIEITDRYVWLAAGDGLNRIDKDNGQIKYYRNHPLDNNSISNNVIRDLYSDSKGMLWLATDFGINMLNPATDSITRYSERDGLPTNLTSTIVEGDNGDIWIGTQSGLSQMVRNEKLRKTTFINYNASDGLGGNTFLPLGSARDTEGRLYFGGDHGLTTFTSPSENKISPPIVISNLLISNKPVSEMVDELKLPASLENLDEITLAYDQNNLSFEYAALDFSNPQKNQYAHMLKGYDKEWIYDNRNFASYTNLDPGDYEFMVRASNAYGTWNEKGKSVKITVRPPWWQTWWAYLIYSLLFALTILFLFVWLRRRIQFRERERTREKQLQQAKEIEKAYAELKATQQQLIQSEKMASLGELTAGIAHEIQNPLNFVNNFSEVNAEMVDEATEEIDNGNYDDAKTILNDIRENSEKIRHHGKRADAIVKGMLQHSRHTSGVRELTDVNALCDEYLKLAYHGIRAKDKSFNCDLKTEFDSSIGKINIVPQDIGRVILNLINNAFYAVDEKKHQQDVSTMNYEPTVSVSTKKFPGKIEITVSDNGNGIPDAIREKIFQPFFTTKPTGQGTGLGLSLAYDIVKAHGGEIAVESREGEGTTFTLQLDSVT